MPTEVPSSLNLVNVEPANWALVTATKYAGGPLSELGPALVLLLIRIAIGKIVPSNLMPIQPLNVTPVMQNT